VEKYLQEMTNRYRQSLGKWGEDIALKFLENQGLRLLFRNYRTQDGELDLVMNTQDQLVIVEVKTRKNIDFGTPEESITDEKIEHLIFATEWLLQQHPEINENWRIDVVSIIGTPAGMDPQIDWFENVS
jgi:putative endonuclease